MNFWLNLGPVRIRVFPRGWRWDFQIWASSRVGKSYALGPVTVLILTPEGITVHDLGEARIKAKNETN